MRVVGSGFNIEFYICLRVVWSGFNIELYKYEGLGRVLIINDLDLRHVESGFNFEWYRSDGGWIGF